MMMVSINGKKTNGFLSTHLPISSWSNTASKRIDSSSCKLSVPVVVSSSARSPQNTLHKLSNLPEYKLLLSAPYSGWLDIAELQFKVLNVSRITTQLRCKQLDQDSVVLFAIGAG